MAKESQERLWRKSPESVYGERVPRAFMAKEGESPETEDELRAYSCSDI